MSWLISNALIASLLIVVVLAIRRPVAQLFGARAAYALWLAPAGRLVLPPLPQGMTPSPAGGEAVNWVLETSQRAADVPSAFPSLWIIWAIGFGLLLAVRLFAHHRFLGAALAEGRPYDSPAIAYDVIATPAVDGPVATGLIQPLILVPLDFATRFTPEQQHFALWHEQLHHRRGDLWAAAAALVTTAILWFNPFAHLALGAFRRDMESACDASLLTCAGHAAAPAYAETILRCAARPVPRSLCALTSIDELKGRLRMLNVTHGAGRKLVGLLLAAGVAVAGLAIAAPASADEQKEKTVVEKRITIGGEGTKDATWKDGQEMKVDCPGELTVIEASVGNSPDKQEKAKMVFCAKSGDKSEAAAGLEKALARIEKDGEMNAALRADVSAKLRAKIAELRAGN